MLPTAGKWVLLLVDKMYSSKIYIVASVFYGVVTASLYGESSSNHSCVLSQPLLSCSPPTLTANASKVLDTCCSETFGGMKLKLPRIYDTYSN